MPVYMYMYKNSCGWRESIHTYIRLIQDEKADSDSERVKCGRIWLLKWEREERREKGMGRKETKKRGEKS